MYQGCCDLKPNSTKNLQYFSYYELESVRLRGVSMVDTPCLHDFIPSPSQCVALDHPDPRDKMVNGGRIGAG